MCVDALVKGVVRVVVQNDEFVTLVSKRERASVKAVLLYSFQVFRESHSGIECGYLDLHEECFCISDRRLNYFGHSREVGLEGREPPFPVLETGVLL